MKKRMVLLIGGGSCVPWVLEALDRDKLEIVLGISHKRDTPGLELLRSVGVKTIHEPRLRFTKEGRGGDSEYFRMVRDNVIEVKPNLVLCLGWDLILPAEVVSFWHALGIPTVNLHPALVSEDGKDVQTPFGPIEVIRGQVEDVMKEVLERKLRATGCTLHIIPPTGEVDEGRVLDMRIISVEQRDTVNTLRERERKAERDLVQNFVRKYQKEDKLW